jgi:hypothetical protein
MKLRLLLALLAVVQLATSQTKAKTTTKTINKNGYTISYPSYLRADETTMNGSDFFLFTEKTDPQDNFVENINLVVQNLATLNIDLDKFVDITTGQISTRGKLLESKRHVRNGTPYHVLVYEGNFDGLPLKFLQYDFVKNDKAYILTYSAKKDAFDIYFVELAKVMNSFNLK